MLVSPLNTPGTGRVMSADAAAHVGRAGAGGCWLMMGSVSLPWLFSALNPIKSSAGEWCFTGSWSEPVAWDGAHGALRAASTHRRHKTFQFPKGWICPCYRLGAKPFIISHVISCGQQWK